MRRLAYFALAAALLYPALMLLYAISPTHAIHAYKGLVWAAKAVGIGGAIAFCALAVLYPPFLENVRRARQRLFRRMTANWKEIQRLEQLLASGGTPGLALKLGTAYFMVEDYARAAALFEQTIAQDKDPPVSAQFRLGVCYLQLQQPEKARPPLQAAHAREPNHSSGEVLLRLADAHRLTGDLASARRFYDAFEKYSAGTPELHYHFGLLHEAEGDRSAARDRMKKSLESYHRLPLHLRKIHRLPAKRARWFLLTYPSA